MRFAIITKENQILKRALNKYQITNEFTNYDRLFFLKLLQTNKKLKQYITLVKPETILRKWKCLSKLRWSYFSPITREGRPPLSESIRNLIIDMKKDNYSWGFKRVFGEILKLNIDTSVSTIRRVIQQARKDGDIPPDGSWKKFIKSHTLRFNYIKVRGCESRLSCDFFTIETDFNRRLYVFFLMEMKTRKIIQFGVTAHPTLQFVSNQLKRFM
jgi:putative transposase